jgi:hypothetical protein
LFVIPQGSAFAVACSLHPHKTCHPERSEGPPYLLLPVLPNQQQTTNNHQPFHHPQTIFHAFAQQNRMSSPQTHQKTNNSNPINKIKVSAK